jgi:hypothetical protein
MGEGSMDLGSEGVAHLFHLMLMTIAFHSFAESTFKCLESVNAGAPVWNLIGAAIFLLTAVRFLVGNAHHIHRWCGKAAPSWYLWPVDFLFIFVEAVLFTIIARSLEDIFPAPGKHELFWPSLLVLFAVDILFAGSSLFRHWLAAKQNRERPADDKEKSLMRYWLGFSSILGPFAVLAWDAAANQRHAIGFGQLALAVSVLVCIADLTLITLAVREDARRGQPKRAGAGPG